MKITRITTRKHPDQIIVRVILDTDRLKDKAKGIFSRLAGEGKGTLIDIYA